MKKNDYTLIQILKQGLMPWANDKNMSLAIGLT
jgi:hypothetical protein